MSEPTDRQVPAGYKADGISKCNHQCTFQSVCCHPSQFQSKYIVKALLMGCITYMIWALCLMNDFNLVSQKFLDERCCAVLYAVRIELLCLPFLPTLLVAVLEESFLLTIVEGLEAHRSMHDNCYLETS